MLPKLVAKTIRNQCRLPKLGFLLISPMGIPGLWEALTDAKETESILVSAQRGKADGLKVAVDISIWSFHCAAASGGDNPALRTFYYRLCRLASSGIKAVFVFDGSDRPAFKRGKKTSNVLRSLSAVKTLIELFGFETWQAPGEAEAECAQLQKEGLVDAVITDDVDALMFGANRVYKHWAALNQSGTKSASSCSHSHLYTSQAISKICRLESSGMILVAMMAGGDYVPAGVPGCGVKTAIEIAVAGFGQRLLESGENLSQWRAQLRESLTKNSDGHFTRKHPSLLIPESFPDLQILRHYTHPVVSSEEELKRKGQNMDWSKDIDVFGLRVFSEEFLDWTGLAGDAKVIRTLVQPVFTRRLRLRHAQSSLPSGTTLGHLPDKSVTGSERALCPFKIHSGRNHGSSGHLDELRISLLPLDVVPLKLHKPNLHTTGLSQIPLNLQSTTASSPDTRDPASSTSTNEAGDSFDFEALHRFWILRSYIEEACPKIIKQWDSAQEEAARKKLAKPSAKKTVRNRTLHEFFAITKGPKSRSVGTVWKTNIEDTSVVDLSDVTPHSIEGGNRKAPKAAINEERCHQGKPSQQVSDTINPSKVECKSKQPSYDLTGEAKVLKHNTRSSRKNQNEPHLCITTSSPDAAKATKNKSSDVKRIVLRKSLPGAWRLAGVDEDCHRVQVIDLT